jgi:peptidoglycan hydrolase-like protein with peptidoglycan-binding domain
LREIEKAKQQQDQELRQIQAELQRLGQTLQSIENEFPSGTPGKMATIDKVKNLRRDKLQADQDSCIKKSFTA